jgi:hypothetical protein
LLRFLQLPLWPVRVGAFRPGAGRVLHRAAWPCGEGDWQALPRAPYPLRAWPAKRRLAKSVRNLQAGGPTTGTAHCPARDPRHPCRRLPDAEIRRTSPARDPAQRRDADRAGWHAAATPTAKAATQQPAPRPIGESSAAASLQARSKGLERSQTLNKQRSFPSRGAPHRLWLKYPWRHPPRSGFDPFSPRAPA